MTKRKRCHVSIESILERPWCYYCERDFDDLKILISHQKAKHYRCDQCGRRLNTAGGLAVHMSQVHKEQLQMVENALQNRKDVGVEIFGMEGIPADVLEAHKQQLTSEYFRKVAEWRNETGNPPPGTETSGQKRVKAETAEELKQRLAEHKAKKETERRIKAGFDRASTTPHSATDPFGLPGSMAAPTSGSPMQPTPYDAHAGSPGNYASPYGAPPYAASPYATSPYAAAPYAAPSYAASSLPPSMPYAAPSLPQGMPYVSQSEPYFPLGMPQPLSGPGYGLPLALPLGMPPMGPPDFANHAYGPPPPQPDMWSPPTASGSGFGLPPYPTAYGPKPKAPNGQASSPLAQAAPEASKQSTLDLDVPGLPARPSLIVPSYSREDMARMHAGAPARQPAGSSSALTPSVMTTSPSHDSAADASIPLRESKQDDAITLQGGDHTTTSLTTITAPDAASTQQVSATLEGTQLHDVTPNTTEIKTPTENASKKPSKKSKAADSRTAFNEDAALAEERRMVSEYAQQGDGLIEDTQGNVIPAVTEVEGESEDVMDVSAH